jgi:hypothetical protein
LPTPAPTTPVPTPLPTPPPTFLLVPGKSWNSQVVTKPKFPWRKCLKVAVGTISGKIFRCLLGGCIPSTQVCNGYRNCNDNSDETIYCPSTCSIGPCLSDSETQQRIGSFDGYILDGAESHKNCNENSDTTSIRCQGKVVFSNKWACQLPSQKKCIVDVMHQPGHYCTSDHSCTTTHEKKQLAHVNPWIKSACNTDLDPSYNVIENENGVQKASRYSVECD